MTIRNPWLGLASYDVPKGEEEDYLFCGRDEETMDIVRLIDNNLFITLYGSSGIGKTSLLKAGVIPILKRKDYYPLYVRLSQESNEISYAEAIVRQLKNSELKEENHIAMEHGDGNDRLFLWNYFATTRFLNADGREIYPVIILDQFEEVFRDADKAKAELLLQQIYLLLNDELEMPDAEGYSADTNYRFVASIREDFLFVLEDSIDELSLDLYKNNRYRLRAMKPEDARQVVLTPGKDCIEESEKEKVVDKVLELAKKPQSDDIDTLLLSLVCAGTFDKKAGEKITFGDLSIWKDNPMQIYYQDAMSTLNADQIHYIQQHLIREDGSRKRVSMEELKNALGENDFQKLTKGKNRMFSIGDKGQVELLHDKLAMAVYEERKAFEERERKKRLRRRVSVIGAFILVVAGVFFFQNAKLKQQRWKMLEIQSRLVAKEILSLTQEDAQLARKIAVEILPKNLNNPTERPYTPEAELALRTACGFIGSNNCQSAVFKSQNKVLRAIFNLEGTQILESRYDSTLRILDTKNGEIVQTIDLGFIGFISDYRPDGNQLLIWHDNAFVVLDTQTGDECLSIVVDSSNIHSAAYSPDGNCIITTSGKTIKKWDATTGEALDAIPCKDWALFAVYSPNGKQIAVFERDIEEIDYRNYDPDHASKNTINILDASTYKKQQTWSFRGEMEPYVTFSPDGKILTATEDDDENMKIWDIKTGKLLFTIAAGTHYEDATFSPDGKLIMSKSSYTMSSSSENSFTTMKLWDANTGVEIKTLSGHNGWIRSAVFSKDGSKILSASLDNTLRVWDIETNESSNIIVKNNARIFGTDIHPATKRIAGLCEDSTVKVWDMETGDEVLTLKYDNHLGNLAINPTGNTFAIVSYVITNLGTTHWADSLHYIMNLDFYDLANGALIKTMIDSTDRFSNIAFSLDGQKLVFSTEKNHRIKLLDLKTNDVIWSAKKTCFSLNNFFAFSPDGKKIAVASNPISVLDADTGEELLVCTKGHIHPMIHDIKYSPDGKTIVTASEDKTIRIWDAETGICLKVLEGHTNGVQCVCFSPDGTYIASGAKDETIRVWEANSGTCVSIINGHNATVSNISYTSDGKHIISISNNYEADEIRIWDFPPLQELIDQTRERFKDRPLTDEERKMYYLE